MTHTHIHTYTDQKKKKKANAENIVKRFGGIRINSRSSQKKNNIASLFLLTRLCDRQPIIEPARIHIKTNEDLIKQQEFLSIDDV